MWPYNYKLEGKKLQRTLSCFGNRLHCDEIDYKELHIINIKCIIYINFWLYFDHKVGAYRSFQEDKLVNVMISLLGLQKHIFFVRVDWGRGCRMKEV